MLTPLWTMASSWSAFAQGYMYTTGAVAAVTEQGLMQGEAMSMHWLSWPCSVAV